MEKQFALPRRHRATEKTMHEFLCVSVVKQASGKVSNRRDILGAALVPQLAEEFILLQRGTAA